MQPKHFKDLTLQEKDLYRRAAAPFLIGDTILPNLWLSLAYLNSPFLPWRNFKRLRSPGLRVKMSFFLIFPCLIGSAAHMHYNYKITTIAHAPDAGSTCRMMTPASPPQLKTRQRKQTRVMTLSGSITQDALSIFIAHHSHIIFINHLTYRVLYLLWKLLIQQCWMKLT